MKICKPSSFAEYQELSESFHDFDFNSIEIKPSIDYVEFSVHMSDLPSGNVIGYLKQNGFEVTRV